MRADVLLANRRDTWTYQVLHALQDLPTSQQFLDAIRSRQTINTHESHFFRSALLILESIILMFELSSSCEG